MAEVKITETIYVPDRHGWRSWLEEHHRSKKEIWVISYRNGVDLPSIPYLHAVEEALCFGWIDGIAKTMDVERRVQRFTPRRRGGHWTELNKERARRLIAQGKMTEAGYATLPDLNVENFVIPPDILAALQADPVVWANFQNFPPLYQRIRVSFIDEVRKQPAEFQKRLSNFLNKTRENKTYGVME
ncbi:MAG: YdeI/OmpD-associated family protein [Chloroflexi bacterium]|nr:YdeI/OmpD-associated family protein [Chloroflexota bacterium]